MGYVDMSRTDVVNEDVCARIEKQEANGIMKKGIRAKYLSAWWTKGQVKDWKRITRVPLMPEYDENRDGDAVLHDQDEIKKVDSLAQLAESYEKFFNFSEVDSNVEF
jgi:hypothetical protein